MPFKPPQVWITACQGFTCLMLFVVVPTLIGVSFAQVDDGELAVLYSDVTQELLGVRGPGLHFMKPGVASERYSRRVVSLSVQSRCYTVESIQVNVLVDVQYIFDAEEKKLLKLFRSVGDTEAVTKLVNAIAAHSVLVTCGSTTAKAMYVDRAAVEQKTNQLIKLAIDSDPSGIIGQQAPVKQIDLPPRLTTQLKEKESANEQVNVALREREPVLIDAQTQLEQEDFKAKTVLQDATSEAERIIFKATEDERTVMRELQVLGQQLNQSASELGITAAELLTDVLDAKQRGEAQSKAQQLCLQDCKRAGHTFSCGICYITAQSDNSEPINTVINVGSTQQETPVVNVGAGAAAGAGAGR